MSYWKRSFFFESLKGRNPLFWLLAAFIVFVFLTGGSSRTDVVSLVLLYPLAIMFLGIAIWNVDKSQIRLNGPLVTVSAFLTFLFLIYLAPMPAGMTRLVSGSSINDEILLTAGLNESWRPLAIDPAATLSALTALSVPLAVVVLGIQIGRREKALLLHLLIALGMISGVLGLVQSVGSIESSLYFYDITNRGSAVGLFANRNHHAVVLACLFPMLAVYASSGIRDQEHARLRGGIAIALGALVVPLVLVTGSRAGLVVGLIAVASIFLLYRQSKFAVAGKRGKRKFNASYLIILLGVLALAAITIMMAKAESVFRFTSPEEVEDLRWQAWNSILQIGHGFFPVGAGPGSLARLFQYHESEAMLGSAYLNQAHNDWLDVYLSLGLFGVILVAALVLYGARNMLLAFGSRSSEQAQAPLARLGIVVVSILGLASVVDYPLRTPAGATLFVIGLLWMGLGESRSKSVTNIG